VVEGGRVGANQLKLRSLYGMLRRERVKEGGREGGRERYALGEVPGLEGVGELVIHLGSDWTGDGETLQACAGGRGWRRREGGKKGGRIGLGRWRE